MEAHDSTKVRVDRKDYDDLLYLAAMVESFLVHVGVKSDDPRDIQERDLLLAKMKMKSDLLRKRRVTG